MTCGSQKYKRGQAFLISLNNLIIFISIFTTYKCNIKKIYIKI